MAHQPGRGALDRRIRDGHRRSPHRPADGPAPRLPAIGDRGADRYLGPTGGLDLPGGRHARPDGREARGSHRRGGGGRDPAAA